MPVHIRRILIALTIVACLTFWNIPAATGASEQLDLAPVSAYGAAPPGMSDIILLGAVSLLVIAVQFPDLSHTLTTEQVTEHTIGQLNRYYSTVSYGAVSVTGKVTEWITLPMKAAYYGADNGPFIDSSGGSMMPDTWKMLRDAAPMITEDTAAYNSIFVLHTGPGQESSGRQDDIWSVTYLNYTLETDHGTFNRFAVVPEYEARGFGTLGVYAHEFGHLLGLPDLYDRTNEKVGPWDLMARGAWLGSPPGAEPSELTAWSRLTLGWLKWEYVCEADTTSHQQETFDVRPIELPPEADACSAVLVRLSEDEYYLIEARIQVEFDESLPQEGALITHVKQGQLRSVADASPETGTLTDAAWQPGITFYETINLQASQTNEGRTVKNQQNKMDLYIVVVTRVGNLYTVTVSTYGPPLIITLPLPGGI